jgi:oligopeptide/dipeptide ABC transporter ATP-binding protein
MKVEARMHSTVQSIVDRGSFGDPSNTLLIVKDLWVRTTGSRPIDLVRGVSFKVTKGRTLGIVGESGSGKSLSLKGALGLLPAGLTSSVDSVLLRDQRLDLMSARAQRRLMGQQIGVIFQEPKAHLSPFHRVGAQLDEAIALHHDLSRAERRDRAAELLRRAGIRDPLRRMGQYTHELSGGLAQRVLIALALAGDPPLLVADEPTTALDVTVQREILDTLLEVQASESLSVILVSHDVGVVRYMCERVAVMYCGRIVEEGSVSAVFDNPLHPYTKALMQSVPRLSNDSFPTVPNGQAPAPRDFREGCDFASRCGLHISDCDGLLPWPGASDLHRARCVHSGAVTSEGSNEQ